MHYEIPEDLHRKAKAAAATEGLTLKDFVIRSLEAAVKQHETSHRRRTQGR